MNKMSLSPAPAWFSQVFGPSLSPHPTHTSRYPSKAYQAGQCTPDCGAPIGSSGPEHSSYSWSSCYNSTWGYPWGSSHTWK